MMLASTIAGFFEVYTMQQFYIEAVFTLQFTPLSAVFMVKGLKGISDPLHRKIFSKNFRWKGVWDSPETFYHKNR